MAVKNNKKNREPKTYYGIYQGVVTSIQDNEQRGRIKIKCPSVLGGKTESAWCDPMIPVAYDNGGDFCLPAIGETVWVLFIAGDPNKPVWLGGWWQTGMTPLGSNYSDIDKVRIISYADCTITMQEGIININIGEGECDLKIEDKKVTVQGDLIVEGAVTAHTVIAGDVSVHAGVGDAGVGSGTITATSNITTHSTVEAKEAVIETTLEAKTVKADKVETTGDIVSTGGDIKANTISLKEHKHNGVTTGGDDTEKPIA